MREVLLHGASNWLLRGGCILAQSLGLISFRLGVQQRRRRRLVYSSHALRLYAAGLVLFSVLALPCTMLALYKYMPFLAQNHLLAIVGYNRYILLQLCASFTLFQQLRQQRAVVACLNSLVRCRRQLWGLRRELQMPAATPHSARLLCFVGAKLLTIVMASFWTGFLIKHDRASTHICYLVTLLFLYYCQLVLQLALMMFIAAGLLLAHTMEQFNQVLRLVLRPPTFDTGAQLALAERLQHLLRLHARLLALQQAVSGHFGIQLLAFITFALVESVVQCFLMYFIQFSSGVKMPPELVIDKQPHGVLHLINPFGVMFVCALSWNLCLVTAAAHHMRTTFQHTTDIISDSATVRYRYLQPPLHKTLLSGLLYLRQQQLHMYVCGLFCLDRPLVMHFGETMFLYLLILIQFDKTFNK